MPDIPHRKFHKSSYSSGKQENCAEGATTFVRDTRNRSAGYSSVPDRERCAFLEALKKDGI
ncbi:DUF397 domain-containing protein [Nocardiopsis potens]|uniref:DUF397 domain-containing protein n=1 Tax=Nocardiopsis potens TaxID=1246458 RepID=UPI000345A9A5|nr:DUF397 domain-containing protein [Nocardiopsis potens]